MCAALQAAVPCQGGTEGNQRPVSTGRLWPERPVADGLERPGPGFGKFLLFLYEAILYREPRKARAQIWPNLVIFVFSGPLQKASRGQAQIWPNLAIFVLARAHIWPNLASFVLSGPLQRASKGPNPDLTKLRYFCFKRPFTESFEVPGPRFGQIKLAFVLSGPRFRQAWLFLY